MSSMIIQSKQSQKNLDTDLTVGLKKEPIWIFGAQKAHAHVHSTFVLFFCAQNLIELRTIGWTIGN